MKKQQRLPLFKENGAKVSSPQPLLRDFSQSLPMSLLRARESVMRQFRPNLRKFGLTEQQWRILRALSSAESLEVSQIAESTFLLGPSLSRILKDLDKRGLLRRRSSDSDLRRGVVNITPKGLQLIERVGQNAERIYAQIAKRYGTSKLSALQSMLRDLEQQLSSLNSKTAPEKPKKAERG
ncbi:MAG: homoprotocatechuate degradation operon regulator HpaR [Xanthobacteraceae bacterium]|jgi:homoprotocatechuate degradation regulator HpaR|uniref:homoprotocatechuate degradation operon regulator HpaR n=1 Tax=Pseudorhodoplanes sp. TaxID=1934341 RepID=UPI003D0D148E